MRDECCGAYPGYVCDGCPKANDHPVAPTTPQPNVSVSEGILGRDAGYIMVWAPDLPVGVTIKVTRKNKHEFQWEFPQQPHGEKS